MIDPAPPHPTCDRDGAALKRASEASYELSAREDAAEATPPKRARRPKAKSH